MCVTLKILPLNSFLWQIGLGQSEPECESFNVLIHKKQFQVKKKKNTSSKEKKIMAKKCKWKLGTLHFHMFPAARMKSSKLSWIPEEQRENKTKILSQIRQEKNIPVLKV